MHERYLRLFKYLPSWRAPIERQITAGIALALTWRAKAAYYYPFTGELSAQYMKQFRADDAASDKHRIDVSALMVFFITHCATDGEYHITRLRELLMINGFTADAGDVIELQVGDISARISMSRRAHANGVISMC